MAWATPAQAIAHWPDAASIDNDVLLTLLDVATEQCKAYAPDVAQPYPTGYMLATVYQARECYAAASRDSGDLIGIGDYAIRARPLTAAVKALLRPQRGVPAVG